jgi:uncharacterized protein (DUF488 family)
MTMCDRWTIYTIGHSTLTIVELIDRLKQVAVDLLIDVRAIPRSRTNPQFNIEVLPASLADVGITYRHLPALGGRRHRPSAAPPSDNALWRNPSFRNYADYATTAAFRSGLEELLALEYWHSGAIMCAEALWWRCHRRIIADYLLAEGVAVAHIMSDRKVIPATLTEGAQRSPDGTLRYPAPGPAVGAAD